MANINLLPWREEHRQAKKKEFFTLCGMVLVLVVLVAFAWDRFENARIENQQTRNQLLKTEIAKLEKRVAEIKELKKRRQEMIDRMQVIQSLQGNRPEIVKIFDEFVRTVPDGVFFVKVERKGGVLSLEGYAESTNRVSALMRQLHEAEKFENPNLTVVEADNTLGEQGSRFEMKVNVQAPKNDLAGDAQNKGGA